MGYFPDFPETETEAKTEMMKIFNTVKLDPSGRIHLPLVDARNHKKILWYIEGNFLKFAFEEDAVFANYVKKGVKPNTIDEKSRATVPKGLRSALKDKRLLLVEADDCLSIMIVD